MTDNTTRRLRIGDAVIVPPDFCPGCMGRVAEMTTGVVLAYVADEHTLLADAGIAGPYYSVYVDHEHNADGSLIYAESELPP